MVPETGHLQLCLVDQKIKDTGLDRENNVASLCLGISLYHYGMTEIQMPKNTSNTKSITKCINYDSIAYRQVIDIHPFYIIKSLSGIYCSTLCRKYIFNTNNNNKKR